MPDTTERIKKIFLLCFFMFFFGVAAFAQTSKVDELLEKLGKNNPDSVQVKILRGLSIAYSTVDPVKKFYYANQYRLLADKLGIDSLVSAAYLDMGNSYGLRSNLDSALYYFRLGHEKAKASDYTAGIGRGYVNIGYVLDRLDRKKEAVVYYEEGLKIFKKTNNRKGINQCIINLGSMYFDLEEYQIADQYFQQVLDNARKITDDVGLGAALYALAGSKWKIGEIKRSMSLYLESLAIRERIGDLNGIALSNWGLGQLYMDKKEFERALTYYEIALKNNRALKNPYQECAVLIDASKAYLGLKDYDNAEKSAKLALVKARESSSKIAVSLSLEILAEVSGAQKKFKEAASYQADYIEVRDSLNHIDVKKNVVTSDLHRVNNDNKNLEKDNKTITDKNTEYTIVIGVITILLIVVAVLMVLYYKRNHERKVTNELLEKQKREIAEVNEELGALNEELISQMDVVSAQNIELEKLNNVKNKFFSIVSHDLRGPLINLKTLFGLYRTGDLNEEELNGLLVRLEDTTYSTVDFLNNLLEWSKSQLEGMVVNPSAFAIHDIVADNIKLMDSQIRLKSLMVTNNIASDTLIFADPNMVNVVVRNLLSNAIKFCNTADQVIFEATTTADQVIFTIRDSGPGINDKEKANLFNLAHNTSTGTAGEKGHQIGLILCRDMIYQNNGTIEVISELGIGTTFRITLPVTSHDDI